MVTRFIILMPWGRVGSNLVVDLIRQHGAVKLANETFNGIKDADTQLAWLDEFYEIGADQPSKPLIGSKQSILSVRDLDRVSRFLQDNSIRLIRMHRSNLVKAAISQMRAEQYAKKTLEESGAAKWAVAKGSDGLGQARVDPELLLKRIKIMQTTNDTLMGMAAPGQAIDIEYNEILDDIDAVVERLRSFLELKARKQIEVRFEKATSDNLKESVLNYDEVQSILAGTPYESQLIG